MTIDLFVTTFNEATLLPHMVKFYKDRIPHINIKVYDNGSTDNTVDLAKDLGCEVYSFETNGEIRDDLLLQFKNNIWKTSNADWVLIVDCDEWVDITPVHLSGTLITHKAYDMVGIEGQSPDIITDGVRTPLGDKCCGFDRRFIREINYGPGAHTHAPEGYLVYNDVKPNMYHMRYLDRDHLVKRYEVLSQRLSAINKQNNWGWHYQNKAEKLHAEYDELLKTKIKVR